MEDQLEAKHIGLNLHFYKRGESMLKNRHVEQFVLGQSILDRHLADTLIANSWAVFQPLDSTELPSTRPISGKGIRVGSEKS
ncbi:MAG TPA: hypothetical protein VKY74_27835 [Chloroflexia bacterium]|nr:hypothetical protein [Chloroflexia bacterium]